MTDIVERLRRPIDGDSPAAYAERREAAGEIERLRVVDADKHRLTEEVVRLRADKRAISQTVSTYLHEIDRLCKSYGGSSTAIG